MAEETPQSTPSTQQASQSLTDTSANYGWNEIGFHPFAAVGVIVGLAVAVVGKFLATLYHTQEDPSAGVAQTSLWFDWVGITVISVSLVLGALVSHSARPGVRVALVAIGLFLFLMSADSPVVMTNPFF